jgi:hypothetical protein
VTAELEALKAQVIKLGRGRHTGADPAHFVTVVAAVPASTAPDSFALDTEKVDQARKLAGEEFRTLFDRCEIFTPCEAFVQVVPKVLTPAKARDLLALCRVPGKPNNGKSAYVTGK